MPRRYICYGVGGVGGTICAKLAQSGLDVVAVARGEHLKVIQESGLRLRVCAAVLSQCLEARASEAPPAHTPLDEAREAPGRLHEADECMNEPSINE